MKNIFMKRGKTKVKNLMAYIIALAMVLQPIRLSAQAEEKPDYAAATFGSTITTENIKITNNGLAPVVKGGREGLQTISTIWKMEIWMDIDDNFMYDLPENTQVAVTVDYFDGKGKFCLMYDSYNPLYYFDWYNGGEWQQTETVYMENTQTWKSYTFYIDDMKAANTYQWEMVADIRLAAVDPLTRIYPEEDVTFGGIKVEYVDEKDIIPVKFDKASSKYHGNVFSGEEDICLDLECLNVTDEEVSALTKYKVYNTDTNEVVAEGELNEEFAPNESKKVPLIIKNPGTYGIYYVDLEFEYKRPSLPNDVVRHKRKTEFSVVKVFDDGSVNNLMGIMEHYISRDYGNARAAAELKNRAGMGMDRGEVSLTLIYADGQYTIEPGSLERAKTFAENFNGDTLIVLTGDVQRNGDANLPDNPQMYQEYAKMCADIVTQLKGITNYFEIWNEPNITFGNKDLDPPECYVEMCKAAYPAIKKANPDAFVVVGATAASDSSYTTLDKNWHEKAFAAGLADYMDGVSFHPYEWQDSFRDRRFIQGFKDLREMMNKYGAEDKQIWVTEFGFSSNAGAPDGRHNYTEEQQAQNTVMAYQLTKSLNLADVFIYYKFNDWQGPWVENRWGWIRPAKYHKTEDHVENAAKQTYVTMAAANQFMGVYTTVKDMIEDLSDTVNSYITWGYNSKTEKDVAMLHSSNDGAKINLKLGCDTVDMYDSYGNKIDTIFSDNGIFSLSFGKDVIYLEGHFTEFEKTDDEGSVITDTINKNAARDDSVIFNFRKNTDKNLKIDVDGAEIIENKGFAGNDAVVKLKVPADAQTVRGRIRITDESGKVYYSAIHTANVTEQLDITLTAEQVVPNDVNRWRLRAVIKNNTNDSTLDGDVRITEPYSVASMSSVRHFQALAPGEDITYLFNLPKQTNKSVLDIAAEVDIGDYTVKTKSTVCFSTALYAYEKPVMDGVIEIGEWKGSWIGANTEEDYVKLLEPWNGPSDMSFSGTMMWDEDYFYFMAIVTDNFHFVNHTPGGIDNTWRGDGIQFGIDDRLDINTVEAGVFNELSIAEVPGLGPVIYKQISYYSGTPEKLVLENAELGFKRYDSYTAYECKIPWDDLFYAGYEINPNNPMRFSVLINDNDGAGRKGMMEYTSGIGGSVKNVLEFGSLTFYK